MKPREIESIIRQVTDRVADLKWHQLAVSHPADDDGIWFFSRPGRANTVQVESSTGNSPFIVEGDGAGQVLTGATEEKVVETVVRWLTEAIPVGRLVPHTDPAAFLAAMTPFLETREAENGLLLGILAGVAGAVATPAAAAAAATATAMASSPTPPFLAEWRAGDATAGVAVYLGRLAVLSRILQDQPGAIRAFVDAMQAAHLPLPGVVAPEPVAKAFAEAWTGSTAAASGAAAAAGTTSTDMTVGLRIYQLTEVRAPAGIPGHCRPATVNDLSLAAAWIHAFELEAHTEEPSTLEKARANAANRIAQNKLFMWERSGESVAMAALARESRHGITVNAVYTPPAHRRHGYASALVAAVSTEGLRRGKQFCVLYTDLSNPTSNSIYQKIGYRPVSDSRYFRFHRA